MHLIDKHNTICWGTKLAGPSKDLQEVREAGSSAQALIWDV